MKLFFRHFKFSAFGVALLCVAMGVAILLWPTRSQQVFCYAFGIVLTLCGILQIASYLVGESKGLLSKLMFAGGVIASVAGAWILMAPARVLTLTVIVMGVLLLYHGVMDVKYAFDVKGAQGKAGAPLLFGLLTCGIGILLLVNPFGDQLDLLFMVCGIGFIFDGLTDLYTISAVATACRRYELSRSVQEALETGKVQELSPSGADTAEGNEEGEGSE